MASASAPLSAGGPGASNNKPAERPKSPKQYFGPNLFEERNGEKKPTKALDALLRAIGQYIIDNIGDKTVKYITPQKLGDFYRPFPGDMDKFLREAPPKDLSNLWAVMGYEHILIQANGDRHARPSLPALTLKGFVRWQSVQLLVDPDENVPVLQHTVRNWELRNPDTGEPFPRELPIECCPREPDKQTEEWEAKCGEMLKRQSDHARKSSHPESYPQQKPPPHPKVSPPTPEAELRYAERRSYATYVRPQPTTVPPRARSGTDPEMLFTHPRTVPFSHVPMQPRYRRSPERERDLEREREHDRERDRAGYADPRSSPRHPRPYVRDVSPRSSRRRSFTDYNARDQPDHKNYGPHSASDPHLKTTSAGAHLQAAATATNPVPPGIVPGARPAGPAPHARRPAGPREGVGENIDTGGSDSETSSGSPSDNESPNRSRPLRRRVPRPPSRPTTAHGPHVVDHAVQENIGRAFRERQPSAEFPLAPGHPGGVAAAQLSPRLRPGPRHTNSSDSRRQSTGLTEMITSLPGKIVNSVVNGGGKTRRPHSHDSRYTARPSSRRHMSESDYSSEEELDTRDRRKRSAQRKADYDPRAKDRASYERQRRGEGDRGWDSRDERPSRRHLSRPEPVRRTSSHADAERRTRESGFYDPRNRERDARYGHAKRVPSPRQRVFPPSAGYE